MTEVPPSRLQNFPVSWFAVIMGMTGFVWLHQTHFEVSHVNPAWFIPVVGNILVPIAGVEHASTEISWFFFSIGLIFWLVLLMLLTLLISFLVWKTARAVQSRAVGIEN